MPPKRKRAAPHEQDEHHVELSLGELELRVDAVRSEIEASLDAALSEMRRVAETAVLRLPARIRTMRMAEFLAEHGGKSGTRGNIIRLPGCLLFCAPNRRRAGRLGKGQEAQ